MSCYTYGLGVPSGLFIPTLLCGASFGRLCGVGVSSVVSDAVVVSREEHSGSFSLSLFIYLFVFAIIIKNFTVNESMDRIHSSSFMPNTKTRVV